MTIGRVSTPSGRPIQRRTRGLAVEQYFALAGEASAEGDTLPLFTTSGGRAIRGGGGIVPDIELPAPPDLPVWWSVAAERGLIVAVADSVAHRQSDDEASRARWMSQPEEWWAALVPALLGRVREAFDVSPQLDPPIAERIALLMAARVVEVRWGSEARTEFAVANDPDVRAARAYFPRLSELLGVSVGEAR